MTNLTKYSFIDTISEIALKNRLLTLCVFGVMLVFGGWALTAIPIDAFPDTTPVQVQINTVAPSLSPEEIEQQITLPIELAIGGLPGLKSVRSISKFGLSQVVAIFSDDTKIIDARQYVSERLSGVELSNGIERPQLGPIATGLGEIFHYTISSKNKTHNLEELRTIHDWVIKPQLRKVPGVAEVNSWGGYERQYNVIVSPAKLQKFKITLDDVLNALEKNNKNVGGGLITSSGQAILLQGVGRVHSLLGIDNIVISSFNGVPVKISDVADEIKIGYEIRRGAVTAQGQGEVVLGLAFMLMGENGKVVTEKLKEKIKSIKKSLPEDLEVNIVYDRTELTTEVINTVQHNLISGAILVIVVLLILLGNFRAGFLVALVIPITMLYAIYGMYQFAIAASLLSLGAIDFGIIVDGSVVMTEANLRDLAEKHRELGRPLSVKERLETLIKSCRQVSRPIVFGMGIILVVFFPILTLEGTEGKMFGPMAWTFIFAITAALFVALLLTPVFNFYLLPKKVNEKDSWLTSISGKLYAWALEKIIKIKWIVIILVLITLCLTGFIARQLGGEFVPRLSEGAITINTIRLPGISIAESVKYNTLIEKLLLNEYPNEIRQIWSRIGTAEVATDPMGTELTDIFISLKPREEWQKAPTQTKLVAAMQKTIADLPGLNMIFTQPIEMRLNEMDSGIRSDIGVKIFGDDFEKLIKLSDEVQQVLVNIQGQQGLGVDQLTGQPTYRVEINPEGIARHGLSAKHVLDMIECVGGKKIGEVFEGQKKFPLVVRLPESFREDVNFLINATIPTEDGKQIPLKDLATFKPTEGLATINREWGRRLIRVQCNVVNRDVSSFVKEAKTTIEDTIKLPEGYVIDWGGQFENLARAQNKLLIVVPMTLLLVFFLLYFSLKNIRDVILIYTGIPFALIGGIFSLWFRDIPFSVSAAVGFIALIGIAVLNGQILVSAIQCFNINGMSLKTAVTKAALQRLRPVLATAITDAIGFLPMAISTGIGAEVQRPLATVVIGGVVTSTILTLLVLPILYIIFGKTSNKIKE